MDEQKIWEDRAFEMRASDKPKKWFLVRFHGLVRKKDDDGLWAVAFGGDTAESIRDQFSKIKSTHNLRIMCNVSESYLVSEE